MQAYYKNKLLTMTFCLFIDNNFFCDRKINGCDFFGTIFQQRKKCKATII